MPIEKNTVAPALVLGLCLMGAAAIGAYAFYKVHTLDNTLTVTGSATTDATADSAKWTVSLSRSAYEADLPNAQTRIANDAKQVSDFFTKGGIASDKVTISPVYVDREYSSDQNAPLRYTVRTDVSVESDRPELVQKLSKDISALAARGIVVSAQMPQYYISNLPELRVSLIGKAVEDAKARAEQIAKSTDRSVGALQSASGGVVQVEVPQGRSPWSWRCARRTPESAPSSDSPGTAPTSHRRLALPVRVGRSALPPAYRCGIEKP
jgi:hypothetical protein